MSAELNRRIAEAEGWRMRIGRGVWYLWSPSFARAVWHWNDALMTEDGAWKLAALDGAVPDFSGDPTAALALLAGVRYTHHHSPRGIQMPGSYEYTDRVIIEEDHAHYAANANTFAEAAALAWVSWKEAGE